MSSRFESSLIFWPENITLSIFFSNALKIFHTFIYFVLYCTILRYITKFINIDTERWFISTEIVFCVKTNSQCLNENSENDQKVIFCDILIFILNCLFLKFAKKSSIQCLRMRVFFGGTSALRGTPTPQKSGPEGT